MATPSRSASCSSTRRQAPPEVARMGTTTPPDKRVCLGSATGDYPRH
jgi:hypothetical protein